MRTELPEGGFRTKPQKIMELLQNGCLLRQLLFFLARTTNQVYTYIILMKNAYRFAML